MYCQSCAKLLAAYEHTVSLYTTSVSEIRTLDRDDFRVAGPEMKSVKQACSERHNAWIARGELMKHWHQDHDGFPAKTIPGNDFWPMSQRAEQLRQACRDADDALIPGAKSMAAFGSKAGSRRSQPPQAPKTDHLTTH
jgi:hypothetical protein